MIKPHDFYMTSENKKTVLVTGAGSGIGREIAILFSKKKYEVVLVGRDLSKLTQTSQNLESAFRIIPCDINHPPDLVDLELELKKNYYSLNCLINNAGIYEKGPFEETSQETWENLFRTNLFGLVSVTRLALPFLKKSPGSSIVNISSTAGLRPVPTLSAYCATKSSVISFSQTLALELSSFKIRVNCVCPGIVITPILGLNRLSEIERENVKNQYSQMHPLGRVGETSDIASAVYFLSDSDQSSWITGAVLPVDGGLSLL
jgi:NAD(P)-dependent dehydrogenase (short-subunit alcohol dehydrogenase family)